MEFDIHPFNPSEASEDQWQSLLVFMKKYHELIRPNDPREPDEIRKKGLIMQYENPELDLFLHGLSLPGDKTLFGLYMYAYFTPESPSYENNKYLAITDITILPKYRQNGVASKLMADLYPKLIKEEKHVLISNSEEAVAKDVIAKFGGIVAQLNIENRVYMKDVDWEMISKWSQEGIKKSPNTKLIFNDVIPDNIIEEYAKMFTETMNQIPRDELDISDMTATPKTIRKEEEDRKAINRIKVGVLTIEDNGDISSLSELIYSPTNNTLMQVGLTSTHEKYRGKGLGKWVKAETLLKVKNEYPSVEYISTHNATSNAPMLSINERIGFKKHKEAITVQITTEKLGAYLKSKNLIK